MNSSLLKDLNFSNVSVKLWLLLQKRNDLTTIPLLRECITSALVIAGSLVAMPSVLAQPVPSPSVDIPFSGVVQGVCNFSAPIPGTLVPNSPKLAFALETTGPGGAPGQVIVTCNQPVKLSISAPVQTGGPPIAGSGFSSVTSSNGPSGSNSIPLSPGQAQLAVDMGIKSNSPNNPLPPGNYNYAVTLTVTP